VLRAEVAKSCGFALLDDAAVEILRKASPLPIPPDAMEGDNFEFVVPINFRMRS
jgi:protein TonB